MKINSPAPFVIRVKAINAKEHLFVLLAWLLGTVYFLLQASPSSFGYVRTLLGLPSGNYLGLSQPIRSDEYSTWTPILFQSWKSGFTGVDISSPYRELLHPIYPVPYNDFRALFQPLNVFFHLDAFAWGMSFYWTVLIFGSLVAWHQIGRKFKFGLSGSVFFAIAMFFNSAQQTWLTVLGVNGLLLPLSIYLLYRVPNQFLSLIIATYCGVAVVFATPYLPGLPHLNIILVLALILMANSRKQLRFYIGRILFFVLGQITGIVLNLEEWRAFLAASFPGNRYSSGGELSGTQFVAQFFPSLQYAGWLDLLGKNICESSTFSASVLIIILVYHIRTLSFRIDDLTENYRETRRTYALIGLFILVSIWQMTTWIPIVGKILFWSYGSGVRSLYLSGPLLIIISFRLIYTHQYLKKVNKLDAYLGIALLFVIPFCFQLSKQAIETPNRFATFLFRYDDLLLILIFMTVILLTKKSKSISILGKSLSSITVVSLVFWGLFNPVFDTRKIEEVEESAAAKSINSLQESSGKSLILPEFSKNQNGWITILNPNSFQRVLTLPSMEGWGKLIGTNLAESNRFYLDRYAYITIDPSISRPRLNYLDSVTLPASWFQDKAIIPQILLPMNSKVGSQKLLSFCKGNLDLFDSRIDRYGVFEKEDGKVDYVFDGVFIGAIARLEIVSISLENSVAPYIRILKADRVTRFDLAKVDEPEKLISGFQIVVEGRSNDCFTLFHS